MSRLLVAAALVGLGTLACARGRNEPRALVLHAAGEYEIDDCLAYSPAVVELSGRMERVAVPAPPAGEHIEKGDEPETRWILQLPTTVCTRPGSDPEGKGRELNVILVQLMLSFEQYGMYRHLLGQDVRVSGTLMDSATSDYPAPLVLQVRSLRAATPADSVRVQRILSHAATDARSLLSETSYHLPGTIA